jgi:uncharacterized membrane protein YbhN (UPF0104 family)
LPVTKAYVIEQSTSILSALLAIGIAFLFKNNTQQTAIMTSVVCGLAVFVVAGIFLTSISIRKRYRYFDFFLSFLAMLLGYFLFGFALAIMLAENDPAGLLKPALSALALVSGGLSGILAFVAPAGLGAREAATAAVLHSTLGPAQAAFAALIARLLLMISELLMFLFAILIKPRNAALPPIIKGTL